MPLTVKVSLAVLKVSVLSVLSVLTVAPFTAVIGVALKSSVTVTVTASILMEVGAMSEAVCCLKVKLFALPVSSP